MSRMLKVKKKMASMATGTASGRSTIVKFLGPDGYQVVEGFKSAAVKISGDEKLAKALISDVIKLVAKVGVLAQANKLTAEDVEPARQPVTDAVNDMLDLLEQEDEPREHADLVGGLGAVHEVLCPLLRGQMKDVNLAKFSAVFAYFGGEAFLCALLNDAALASERLTVCTSLRNMVRPYETEDSAKLQATRRRNLEGRRLMAADPKLRDFMTHAEGGQAAFQGYLGALGGGERVSTLQFWLAVEDFKTIVSRPLLAARAPRVADKFLGAAASHPAGVSADVAGAIGDTLFGDAPVRKDVFQAAQTEAIVLLAAAFDAGFVASEQFVAFAGKVAAAAAAAAGGGGAAAGRKASMGRRRSSFPNTQMLAAVAAVQEDEGAGGGAGAAAADDECDSDDLLVLSEDDEGGAAGADETKSKS
jgi:hypothetical protein